MLVATPSFVIPHKNTVDSVQDDRVVAEVDHAFRELGYLRLPTSEFRDRLSIISKQKYTNPPSDYTYAKAAKAMGANAVLVIENLDYTGYSAIAWTHRSLAGTARLLDVNEIIRIEEDESLVDRDGALPLWRGDIELAENQGPDSDVELVIGTMLQAFYEYDKDAIARVYHEFARNLAKSLARGVDPRAEELLKRFDGLDTEKRAPLIAAKPPNVTSVRIEKVLARNAELKTRDTIPVRATGTPNCYAELLLPGKSEPIPLTEDPGAPGTYRVDIEIQPGLGLQRGRICVRLRDRQFRYGGMTSEENIEIVAPELAQNDSLLKIASAENAFVQLRNNRFAAEAGFVLSSGAGATEAAVRNQGRGTVGTVPPAPTPEMNRNENAKPQKKMNE